MVQVVVEKKNYDELDWKRNGIFVVFGFAYLGGFQYWLMVNKFSKWFPTRARFAQLTLGEKLKDTAGMMDALKMVAFDVFVHLPLIYFPCYYTCKEIVTGTSWNPREYYRIRMMVCVQTNFVALMACMLILQCSTSITLCFLIFSRLDTRRCNQILEQQRRRLSCHDQIMGT